MLQDINNTAEIVPVMDDQQLKSLGLKRMTAYVRDDKTEKASKRNAAERQARYRNKERKLKEEINVVGVPPLDVIDFVQANGWVKVSESILLSRKFGNLSRLIQWIFRLKS